jgi:cysteine desulfurase / selenocysteine lyase
MPPHAWEATARAHGGPVTEALALSPRDARELFPATQGTVHFNAAGIGLVATPAVTAVQRCLERLQADPQATHHGALADEARARSARLVGAEPRQIALVPSTTLALNVAADSIPLAAGENVVTCDLEFMSPVVPWYEKCRDRGAELRVVRHKGGRVEPGDVLAQIDDRTRAVVLSSVQWTNGYRLDLEPIGVECERRGVPLVVDGIQQVGALRLDVARLRVSVMACGGHKWLGCPSATGFVYASDDFAARYRPTLTYAPTAIPPKESWPEAWTDPDYDPIRSYPLREDASRFEVGMHHGVLGACALEGALSVIEQVGTEAIEERVLALAGAVADTLRDLDYEIVTPLEPEARSGITTFRAGDSVDDDLALVDFLRERGIAVAARYTSGVGGVRVATHFYNDEEDVAALGSCLAELKR